MPKIILLSSEFPPGPGGIGSHAFHLAHQLYVRGWDIRVITPQDYAPQTEIERFNQAQPFSIHQVPSGRGWLREAFTRMRVLVRLVHEKGPSLLLASGRSAVFLAALAAPFLRLRLVAVGHGTEFGTPGLVQRAITCLAYSRASTLICVSHFTRGLAKKLGIRPDQIEVIQNGADAGRFQVLPVEVKQDFARKLGLQSSPNLLTVGSVTERKGQEVVIRAMPEILREFPSTRYYMAGLPQEQPRLERLALELGVAQSIRFLGRVSQEDLVGWYNCCDIFLMTSRTTHSGDSEGFGIAAVEAALCGKPAIVSSNSGLAEAVVDGHTGLLIPEGDAHAAAAAVLRLLKDPELYISLSEQARAHACATQAWESVGLKYDRFLRPLTAAV